MMVSRIKGAARALRANPLSREGGALFFAATTFVNISNFVFHIVVSRQLGPSAYGALGALLGILLVLQVPIGALEVAVTQAVAGRSKSPALATDDVFIGPLVARAVLLAASASFAIAVLSPALRTFLHVPTEGAVLLVAADLVPIVVGLVPKSLLLGYRRFRALSYCIIAGAVVRLVMGVVLTRAGKGVPGAVAAVVLGDLAVAALLIFTQRQHVKHADDHRALVVATRDAGLATAAFGGFWLQLAIDTLLARHFLTRLESGYYAAAATAARAVLFLPGAVALVAFPQFAATDGKGEEARRALVHALVLVAALSLGAAAVITVDSRLFVTTIFGGAFGASTAVVGVLGLSAAAMALTSILMHYLLACRSPVVLFPWVSTAGVVLAVSAFHSSITTVGDITLIASLATFGVLLTAAQTRGRSLRRESPADAALRLGPPTLDLSLVIPFYNPGEALRPNVDAVLDVLGKQHITFELIAVSDGSTDGSERSIADIPSDVLTTIIVEKNAGKGAALRVGLARSRGAYVGFMDADGDIDPSVIPPSISVMSLYGPDIVLGSKRHPMSEVEYPGPRRLYSWGYQQLIRVLFHLNIRDTQTGVKFVRREVLARTLPLMVEKRFAFDLELFVIARRLGYSKVFEVPVSIQRRFTSTISLRSVRGMLTDTLAIFYRLYILRSYDLPTQSEPLAVPITGLRDAR